MDDLVIAHIARKSYFEHMAILDSQTVLQSPLGEFRHLSPTEAARRARRIRLLLTDNDGVLTDTGVYYGQDGELFKRYSIRDGMGVERLRCVGIETAIVTGETSVNLTRRAEKLHISRLYLGIKDKAAAIDSLVRATNLDYEEIAFIGDDVNDLTALDIVGERGITAAPSDAMPQIRSIVHYTCRWSGGNGAFRDFAEALITLRTF
jgi:3-deoxy-D-manno-octulosonate 8-phosphate phosphatase (KDO 8-P phosphatase)